MLTLDVTGTEATVCKLIELRQQVGIKKYKTTVRDNPLSVRQWHVHFLEELLDAAIYSARIIEQMDSIEDDGR